VPAEVTIMPQTSEYLLLPEVAEACRAPLSSVRYWIAKGKLPSIRPGRRRLVHRQALERFLEDARAGEKWAAEPAVP
jgi:excisionase family DNA binding protein